MKSNMFSVPMVMTVMSALVIKDFGLAVTTAKPPTTKPPTTKPTTTRRVWTTTAGTSETNLNGKMFTLSAYRGGISFYPPYFSPTPTHWSYTRPTTRPYYTTRSWGRPTTRPYYTTRSWGRPTTRPYYTTRSWGRPTTRPYYTTRSWTTAPPTRSVSVCLRYLLDGSPSLFTLSPSSRDSLKLELDSYGYQLTFKYRDSLYLRPNIKFWSNLGPDIWTRVCLTIDSTKNVAQLFSGSNMSIRKMLPIKYGWSGEPVIDFSGFGGQVTDVQVWDYPLRYGEVYNYMTGGVYIPYRGSVLTWSYISYSPRGIILMEDVYERQEKQPIRSSGRRRGRRPKGEKKARKFFSKGESKREQL